ncbi:hypothetical protein [Streptomyces sp. NPDC005407]|uniref:hypothetical protein n=1 Tax=Streptomyces sp. NPDC005407 TaxID=3155340 RepID=UPI0033B0D3F2
MAQHRTLLVIGLVAALAAAGALLAEWQRRTTLLAVVTHAPAGTVVVQERGRGGPAMEIHVGTAGAARNHDGGDG